MEKKYTIECNEKQLRLIAQALEMHSRAICGQIEESFSPPIHDELWKHYDRDEGADNSEYYKKRKEVDEHLLAVKRIIWDCGPGASMGVGYDPTADLGYEMYKEILHQFEKEDKEECNRTGREYFWNVHSEKPCLKFTNEPTIKVKKNL